MSQLGINYQHEDLSIEPIVDAAYVMMKFNGDRNSEKLRWDACSCACTQTGVFTGKTL